MTDNSQYFSTNKITWNNKVKVHAESEMYAMDAFKKGKNSLMPCELNALGDVTGKSLLHLQCHFGLDSLSWARLGAEVTAVDLSSEAIKQAEQLAEKTGLQAEFICQDVYGYGEQSQAIFDWCDGA